MPDTETARTPRAPAPAPRVEGDRAAAVRAAVVPYLRALLDERVDAQLDDADVLTDARPAEVIDALDAAGLLVLDDRDDRAHLRASWAAMSSILIRLGERKPPRVDDLRQIPAAHRSYLQGHAVTHRHLDELWQRIEAAQVMMASLIGAGRADEPVSVTWSKLGDVAKVLRGEATHPAGWPALGAEPTRDGPGVRDRHGIGCRHCGVDQGGLHQDLAHEPDCNQRPHAQVFDLTGLPVTWRDLPVPGGPRRFQSTGTPRVVGDLEDEEGDPQDRADHAWPIDGDILVGDSIGDTAWLVVAWVHRVVEHGTPEHWWVLAIPLPNFDRTIVDIILMSGVDQAAAWRAEHRMRIDGGGRTFPDGGPA